MRKVWSISLVILFLANTIGSISLLLIHRHGMREYISSLISSENYSRDQTQLKFTTEESDQLVWYKEAHEFRYNGHMYDVVKKESKEDGTIIYHCIKDEKENEIYRDIADDFNHPSPGQNQDRTLVLQLFKFLSHILITLSSGTFTDVDEIRKSRFTYMDTFHPVYLSITCEPPDIT